MHRVTKIALATVGIVLLSGGGVSWAAGSNTKFGTDALAHDDSGGYNSAFGFGALFNNTTGSYNTASGYGALEKNIAGLTNTASGYEALFYNTADYNTAIGGGALYNNTTGASNTAVGAAALNHNTTGANDNTAIGDKALFSNTTGTGNTASGYEAGLTNTSGTDNTFIGDSADANAGTYKNGTALGAGALLTASDSIVLGNDSITKIYARVTSITAISDRRLKKDIADLDPDLGLDFIEKLKPVSYRFRNGDETERYGFIAQDLEQALPAKLQDTVEQSDLEHGLALVERQNDADRTYRVSYGELTAPMVKAIQEQQQEIADLRKALEVQAAENAAMRSAIAGLQKQFAMSMAQNSPLRR
jgi:trimeric autotransporter adhesin